ncbi:hypothetical protein TK11N_15200 [Tetragenococcus koreensis]|uniref:Uncharacterized protein n=1 Tax=Tetragenococcus koreensis TaxID=290335 RepID=A0AAN4ZNJ7_9ENTE|nr:hypothetical protein TK11N_15200 [Tetragenococcus koreensis]GEQ52114.1 hypothetical protein TK12N_14580 [Tetragenococcus koreensis]GEQ54649.1 hypothetical protein TK2N_14930 [Tetragenococcus koreensis]GEQ57071.1 hypothetical protein TK4N_14140 [Tetragenococcus koreensis]GEQ59681.1 hypothetical protein TK6N_15200 [Tetragenococcus koreensis]
MKRKFHVRREAGENLEITSKDYLSLFNFRVALGRMSELGYGMMFGDVDKDFFLKKIKGRGYADTGDNVISEFYTPLVPRGHDFLATIQRLTDNIGDKVNF